MTAASLYDSALGVFLALTVLSLLALLWVIALFMLVFDSISVGAKILWFLALTCLAPVAIPVYFLLRHRRHRLDDAADRRIASA